MFIKVSTPIRPHSVHLIHDVRFCRGYSHSERGEISAAIPICLPLSAWNTKIRKKRICREWGVEKAAIECRRMCTVTDRFTADFRDRILLTCSEGTSELSCHYDFYRGWEGAKRVQAAGLPPSCYWPAPVRPSGTRTFHPFVRRKCTYFRAGFVRENISSCESESEFGDLK